MTVEPQRTHLPRPMSDRVCVSQESGERLWSRRRRLPFFSSPNCSSGHALIGSADGSICCYGPTGKLVRPSGANTAAAV